MKVDTAQLQRRIVKAAYDPRVHFTGLELEPETRQRSPRTRRADPQTDGNGATRVAKIALEHVQLVEPVRPVEDDTIGAKPCGARLGEFPFRDNFGIGAPALEILQQRGERICLN